jgi:hypothetical protein
MFCRSRCSLCEDEILYADDVAAAAGDIVGVNVCVRVGDVGVVEGVGDGVGVRVGVFDGVGVTDGVGRIQVIGSRPKISVALWPARASVISPVVTNLFATGSKISALLSGL